MNVNVANKRLLRTKAPSRLSGESIPPGDRNLSPRQAMRPIPLANTTPKKPRRSGPMSESLNAWTDCTTPERVRNVPRIVSENVAMTSDRFHTRINPRLSWTIEECRYAVAHNQGKSEAFSTGSHAQNPPQPSTW